MKNKRHLYSYNGPIYIFDRMIAPEWSLQTYAVSEGQAKSNFEYQTKMKLGLLPNSKVRLPSKVVLIF